MDGIVLQPGVHDPVGDRAADQQRDDHEENELAGQEVPEVEDRRPQYLSHADLPGALLRHKGRQAQQTKTRDENSEQGKETGQFADALLIAKLLGEFFVGKLVFKGILGVVFFEDGLDGGYGLLYAGGWRQPDVHLVYPVLRQIEDHRMGIAIGALRDHILCHANDRVYSVVTPPHDLADGMAKIHVFDGRFIDDKRACEVYARGGAWRSSSVRCAGACVGVQFRREIPALYDLPADRPPKVRCHGIGEEALLQIGVFPLPFVSHIVAPAIGEVLLRATHCAHQPCLYEFVADGLEMLCDIGRLGVGHEQSLAGISDGSVFYILDLPEYGDGPDDKDHGDRELYHYQCLAWQGGEATYFKGSFQYFDRLERRQVKRGIAAGDQSGGHRKAETGQPEKRLLPGYRQCLPGDLVKKRQQ